MAVEEHESLLSRLCDTEARVVFFPVRHHSPMCAAMVSKLILDLRPAAVLIEGPSDYNPHLDELRLTHRLPIAIYSYFGDETGRRRGAFYPFCEYSPEWQAMRAAESIKAEVRFIDLPWVDVADIDDMTHRYADAELRRGRYVTLLCERLEVESFDDLWDKLIEAEPILSPHEFLRRVHSFCTNVRVWEDAPRQSDLRREAYMADEIRRAMAEFKGRLLVVTGGFHSSALVQRLETAIDHQPQESELHPSAPDDASTSTPPKITDRGIALTAYTYERLDSLTGYNAGMPNPGFYDHVWQAQSQGKPFGHRPLLAELALSLRERKQVVSTADLIAVETSACTLAALRGRQHVWRSDLVDAVTSALIKDELEFGCVSPFLDAVHRVLRGDKRGQLAEGTRRPPLVIDIRNQLVAAGLEPTNSRNTVELNLLDSNDLAKSRLLHRISVLELAGFNLKGGTDFLSRKDLTRLWETWEIQWRYEYDATCVEAARYGATLAEAAATKLLELAEQHQHEAKVAAELLVTAARADVHGLSDRLLSQLETLIRREPNFLDLAAALGHLLYLFCHDEIFGTARNPRIGAVAIEAFHRALWLLESLGTTGDERKLIAAMRALQETYERGSDRLELNRDEYVAVLTRVEQAADKLPSLRGAAAGMLWTLGESTSERILERLLLFANAEHLGDFLNGLFALAREVAQRNPQLVQAIDQLLLEFASEEFQSALPSLRLAFTYFTPREKHYMLKTLFDSLGLSDLKPLTELAVDEETAAMALVFEERLFAAVERYGLNQAEGGVAT
ncbi:MAG: hypothetical protein JWP89_3149 [Schlesneria sp.]|nr:hypothetical protein [Schlesneria sp.]